MQKVCGWKRNRSPSRWACVFNNPKVFFRQCVVNPGPFMACRRSPAIDGGPALPAKSNGLGAPAHCNSHSASRAAPARCLTPLPRRAETCRMSRTPPAEHGARKLSPRTLLPRVLNLLLWLGLCGLAGTGLLLAWRLPPGSRGGHGLELFGLGRHDWGDVHTWVAYFFIAMILAHLALHWRWLWQIAARKRPWPVLAGFGLGLAVMVVLLFAPVSKREGGRGGAARAERVQ
jgi:hypothetical protein